MANLVAAIEHMQWCQLQTRMAADNLQRNIGYVVPSAWTERIEGALASKNKFDLDYVKVRRMSVLVCYEAADLTFLYHQEEFKAAETRLMDAVKAAAEAHQILPDTSTNHWLKTGLESNWTASRSKMERTAAPDATRRGSSERRFAGFACTRLTPTFRLG